MPGFDLGGLLRRYLDPTPDRPAESADVDRDFGEAADALPREHLGHGVAEAFRSPDTPPFPDMLADLFNRSDSATRAGVLGQLAGVLGPAMLGGLAGGLGRGRPDATGDSAGSGRIDPRIAEMMSPDQVRELAARAERDDPGVVERLGAFYAEHPTLVQGLGVAALSLILKHVAGRDRPH